MSSAYNTEYIKKLKDKVGLYEQLDRNDIYVRPLLKHLEKGSKVLDIATGISDIPLRLVRAGYSVVAIDFNEDVNRIHRPFSLPEATFINGDALNMPFAENEFKGIVLKDIIEHIRSKDISNLLSGIDKILAKGGLLVVGCPVQTFSSKIIRSYNKLVKNNFSGIDDTGDMTHINWFTENSLLNELKRLKGYKVIDVKYLMYGVNNFPRAVIRPLYNLQKLLHGEFLQKSFISRIIQKLLGFRIVVVLLKY